MTSAGQQRREVTCKRCRTVVEFCALCERGECPDPLCYRCVRITLGQEIPQPHSHGG